MDLAAVRQAATRQAERVTPGIDDLAGYRAAQVADQQHNEAIGPMLDGAGASGVVVHRGRTIAQWGDPDRPEMCFSLTKSLLATVAGLAVRRGLLADVDEPVSQRVDHPAFTSQHARRITWRHLLQQTSGWNGELWGKPTWVDTQSGPDGHADSAPGAVWAYNDVRVNLLALALTLLWRRGLGDVLRTELLDPLGISSSWSWHGYTNSDIVIDGQTVPVVSGGAHWGGGVWASAQDLALLGVLYLTESATPTDQTQGGSAGAKRLFLGPEWIEASWRPSDANPDYGYMWWLNDGGRVFPAAPTTGRCARGNLGRHLLWVDPARELVIVSHWGNEPEILLRDVSAAVPPSVW
ncbi:serine hydrolase domain-containing protein [Micromonospora sp. CA-263727]|uniref:serine hydrolase domain-containing protein n=1 Tax=Micromonospora sp. CA-263727 TaxID=3239967 RepID=UPI003D938310